MTFNEINSGLVMPIMGLGFSIQKEEDKYQPTFQAFHHQFVASAIAVKACHEIIPDAKIGCMILFAPVYSYDSNPENVMYALKEERFFNFFCADVQVRGEYPSFIKRYFEEHNMNWRFRKATLN
jgi:6-phospho-beta-glucosidase